MIRNRIDPALNIPASPNSTLVTNKHEDLFHI